MTRIRNESVNITTDLRKIKRIIKEYNEQLHTHQLDNLDEMDTFLETTKTVSKSNRKYQRPIISKEIKLVIKKIPTKPRWLSW